MKKDLNGPAAAAIIAVAAIAICVGFYFAYFHRASKSPAEVQAGLASGFQKTMNYFKTHPTANGPAVPASVAGQATHGGATTATH